MMIGESLRLRSSVIVLVFSVVLFLAHHGYADAPPERYVASNGTVLDTKTNLLWQQGHQGNTLNWNDAQVYCSGLSVNGLGAWRLPTVKELQTLVHEGAEEPAIDTKFAMTTPAEYFWTASLLVGSSDVAWVVSFYGGAAKTDDDMVLRRVRCVR